MASKKTKRERSPAHPIIGLKEAVKRVNMLYKKEGKNPIPREIAVTSIGYKSISGRSLQTLSSLSQYGLILKAKGKVRISDKAFVILNAPEDSSERIQVLAQCSLEPPVFEDIYNNYGDKLPSDETLIWYLQQKDYSKPAAKTIIQSYKETITFAKPPEKVYDDGVEQENSQFDDKETPSMNDKPQKAGIKPVVLTVPIQEITMSFTASGGELKPNHIDMMVSLLNSYKAGLGKIKPK